MGPFVGLAVNSGSDYQLSSAETGTLVASGIIQSLCLVGVIVGASVKTESRVAAAPSPPRWMVLPSVAPHYGGIKATVFSF